MKVQLHCPVCCKPVRIVDPCANEPVKTVSAWFAKHKDATGKTCAGSQRTAIARDPLLVALSDHP